MMNKYYNVFPVDKETAERIFASGDIENICHTMVSVAYFEKDWKWAQDKNLEFLANKSPEIRGLAATCLGHIARVHGRLEKEKVVKLLASYLNDGEVSGRVKDAISDIEQFAST